MAGSHAPGRRRLAVTIVDLVESVRLMQADEDRVIDRWRAFVHHVRDALLPEFGGRLVKSLGDGMLLVFDDAPRAVACAVKMGSSMREIDAASVAGAGMSLRTAIHVTEVVVDDLDIFGSGVNLVARLATLARPGDIVLSSEARDPLIAGWDAEVEDLGYCYLKHLDAPVRAWRLARHEDAPVVSDPRAPSTRLAALAVVPVRSARQSSPSMVACVYADQIAAVLRRSSGVLVIGRPSVAAVSTRGLGTDALFRALNVPFVVQVKGDEDDGVADIAIALHGREDAAPWHEWRCVERISVREEPGDTVTAIAAEIGRHLGDVGLAQARFRHLPGVESYALLLSSIASMHRQSLADCDVAKRQLDELVERHPRAPEPRSWSAKWHMLKVAQRWSADEREDVARAQFQVSRALDSDPEDALALAISGHIRNYQFGDLEGARDTLARAVQSGPNEPFAWLFVSNLQAHEGEALRARESIRRALDLSPADATRFLFEMFAAQVALCEGEYANALRFAQASIRHNSQHLPTYPALIIASVLNGDMEGGVAASQRFRALFPAASASAYRRRFRGPPEQSRLFEDALRRAGVPE